MFCHIFYDLYYYYYLLFYYSYFIISTKGFSDYSKVNLSCEKILLKKRNAFPDDSENIKYLCANSNSRILDFPTLRLNIFVQTNFILAKTAYTYLFGA